MAIFLTLLVCAFLFWATLRAVPRWLLALLGLAMLMALFPTDVLSGTLSNVLNEQLLGPLLTLAIMGLGFWIMLRAVFGSSRRRCSRCGYADDHCRCRRW